MTVPMYVYEASARASLPLFLVSPLSRSMDANEEDLTYLDVFHADRLQSEDDLQTALQVVAALVEDLRSTLISTSLKVPGALVFILSALDESALQPYLRLLHSDFDDPTSFIGSLASQVLRCCLRTLADLTSQSDIAARLKDLESAEIVLSAIHSNRFDELRGPQSSPRQPTARRERAPPMSAEERAGIVRSVMLLGHSMPQTYDDYDCLVKQLIFDQKLSFTGCVARVRQSQVAKTLATSYLTNTPLHSSLPMSTPELSIDAPVRTSIVMDEYVRPVSETLGLEAVKGFGPWQILLGTRARGDFRMLNNKTPRVAKILAETLRELSKGVFTSHNQKRLNRPGVEANIYSARIQDDLRMVYHIDCVANGPEQLRQAIKIFGLFTHAQMDKRLWATISSHLATRTAHEQHQCSTRHKNKAGIYVPALFPYLLEDSVPLDAATLPLAPELQSEVHSLLTLQQYVPFSRAYLNSVLADKDTVLPFVLEPQEIEIAEHPGSCYVIGRSGTGKTTTILYRMLSVERAWEMSAQGLRKPRQIFLTKSPLLAQKVGENYRKLAASFATASWTPEDIRHQATMPDEDQALRMVHSDDITNFRSDLPTKFSAIRDEVFPLFLTFDKFMQMLEADVRSRVFEDADSSLSLAGTAQSSKTASYIDFVRDCWSHCPASLKAGLDPMMVYNEILGVIKGSESAILQPDGYIDRDAYVTGTTRATRAVVASDSKREDIYDIFLRYTRALHASSKRDNADRVRFMLSPTAIEIAAERRVDFVYVDEVQDMLLIDALVIRNACGNGDGLFWAGDTAQTISAGSAFRFTELKALMYRAEDQLHEDTREKSRASSSGPREFHLSVNYRSHQGIVECGSSLVRILLKLWPESIDNIGEEHARDPGPKPVFIQVEAEAARMYRHFFTQEGAGFINFGARQCIIVRDESAREELEREVGKIGLVLTVLESKGLEFDDVLLVNFFRGSPVEPLQWRRIFQLALASDVRGEDIGLQSACQDLKQAYVAVTRARHKLCIIDDIEKSSPIHAYWMTSNLVELPSHDVELFRPTDSSSEEWRQQGLKLFHHGQFAQALYAFKRAHAVEETANTQAYILRDEARAAQSSSARDPVALHLRAAHAFIQRAGVPFNAGSRLQYLWIAGNCLVDGHDFSQAANVYLQAEAYDDAAQQYLRSGNVDAAVSVMREATTLQEDVRQLIIEQACKAYLAKKSYGDALSLFPNMEALIEFLDSRRMMVFKALVLRWSGDIKGAAEVYLQEGEDGQGICLLLTDPMNKSWMALLVTHIFNTLRALISFGMTQAVLRKRSNWSRIELLMKTCMDIPSQDIDTLQREELAMFRAIMDENKIELRRLAAQWAGDPWTTARGLLCLDFLFSGSRPLDLQRPAATELETFRKYVQRLQELEARRRGSEAFGIKHALFAISTNSSGVRLPSSTTISRWAREHGHGRGHDANADLILDWTHIDTVISLGLRKRLLEQVLKADTQCRNSNQFRILDLGSKAEGADSLDVSSRCSQALLYSLDWLRTLKMIKGLDRVVGHFWTDNIFCLIYNRFDLDSCRSSDYVAQCIPDSGGGEILASWCKQTLDEAMDQSASDRQYIEATILLSLLVGPDELLSSVRHDLKAGQVLASVLSGISADAFEDGIGLLRLVPHTQSWMNAIWLCHFIRRLCCFAILAWAQRQRRSLDSVLLPRKWLLDVLDHAHAAQYEWIDIEQIAQLCFSVLDIVRAAAGTRTPLYYPANANQAIRGAILDHMIFALRFLSHNVAHSRIRNLLATWKRTRGTRTPGIGCLLEDLSKATSGDLLIKLLHHKMPRLYHHNAHYKVVNYVDAEELPRLVAESVFAGSNLDRCRIPLFW